jgi:alanine racemase
MTSHKRVSVYFDSGLHRLGMQAAQTEPSLSDPRRMPILSHTPL